MNKRTPLIIVIAATVLVAGVLAVALARCDAKPTLATETPGAFTKEAFWFITAS